jgi:CRP/FNR family transcriptional regulator
MTVEAIENVTNLQISRFKLHQILRQYPEVLLELYEDIASKLRMRVLNLDNDYLSAEQRIIKSLVEISQQFGYKSENGIILKLKLTQEYLAAYSGTSRTSVSRLLYELDRQRIIRIMPKPYMILQLDQLLQILHGRKV